MLWVEKHERISCDLQPDDYYQCSSDYLTSPDCSILLTLFEGGEAQVEHADGHLSPKGANANEPGRYVAELVLADRSSELNFRFDLQDAW